MTGDKKSDRKHGEHKESLSPDSNEVLNDVTAERSGNTWQYNQANDNQAVELPSIKPVNWTASEFIDHEKDAGWFLVLAIMTIIADGVIYLATQDITTCVLVLIGAILFGIMAKRKPRTLDYKIDSRGVTIGEKLYPHGQFKSFTVMQEGAFDSIQLLSLKRFMPPISLYCPPDQEAAVIDALAAYLPHEQRPSDPIDNFMRKIRF